METQRILMRSLAVVFIASVIWTITVSADAPQKVSTCCKAVSKAKLTDPIIGFRKQKQSLPCVMAIVFETERGEFCCDPRQQWVKEKVMQFIAPQQTSTA
ncbi:C-C motif chemokine 2-like isoform X2 [Megalobrama amblycephala]|uniref:C-C motif chemokine 2-like isoform X2 n=1 Tax=Megalobrama amblycephala TaxID=75352 RepID=UPI002014564A|nr:C-C motif chemokine 2-like isoform X2 [Megalobrama amblycephala]